MELYLLDTNVISELRKKNADNKVIAWVRSVPIDNLFISVISLLEIETGILSVERKDPKQGLVLRNWLESSVIKVFENRTIAVDIAVASSCAKISVPNPRPISDALIAATAKTHSMIVVTRNIKDFEGTGVGLLNPWVELN